MRELLYEYWLDSTEAETTAQILGVALIIVNKYYREFDLNE